MDKVTFCFAGATKNYLDLLTVVEIINIYNELSLKVHYTQSSDLHVPEDKSNNHFHYYKGVF